uniref:Uncharacterized protein n=1 Tax=Sipha flava TaxID=143950 RepID=A0A2S2R595_9HEMI
MTNQKKYHHTTVLSLPVSPKVLSGDKEDYFSGSSSFSSDITVDLASSSSSKICQSLKAWLSKTPRIISLRSQLKQEKEARLIIEKTIHSLTNHLTEYRTVDNFFITV